MKSFLFLLTFFLMSLLYGQNYGQRLQLGSAFSDNDSTILSGSDYITSADGDEVYSGLEYFGKIEGNYGFTFYAAISSGSPTFDVYARRYYAATPSGKHYENWHTLLTSASGDSLYKFYYDGSTPSWWTAAHGNGIQYKVVQSGAGTAEHYISHFPK